MYVFPGPSGPPGVPGSPGTFVFLWVHIKKGIKKGKKHCFCKFILLIKEKFPCIDLNVFLAP